MPAGFQGAFQQNMLDTRFLQQIDAKSKLRACAAKLPIPLRTGENRIYTRAGALVPVVLADTVANNTLTYDLGLNAPGVGNAGNSYPIEQYSLTISERSQSLDINIIQDQETLASFYRKNWDRLAAQAALSMDLMAMQQLAQAYESGSTFVTVGATGTTGVVLSVDNIQGLSTAFATATFNGSVFPYGLPASVATNNLGITVYPFSGAASYTGTITAFTQDGSNISSMQTPAGVIAGNSGTITVTFGGSKTVAVGDVIVANDAPTILRPNNRLSRYALQSTDTLGMQLFINARAQLENNGVEPFEDGTFVCLLDSALEAQIFTDPQFQIMSMGLASSPLFKDAKVSQEFGLTFVRSTNLPIYKPNASEASGVWGGASPAAQTRRAFVLGQGAIQEGTFEGMAAGYGAMADSDIGYVRVLAPESESPFALITRPALDRKAQIWSQTWVWVGGHACGTDATVTPAVVPTASAARYKRCVAIETAG
jgi:hypothetical protein